MNKKILLGFAVLLSFALMGNATIFAQTGSNNGKTVSEKHRNDTVKVVEALNKVADKDKAVKDEVKTVAQDEDNASKTVSEKIKEVEGRSAFKTFLIGSDYKNLGALRSELVTTQNRINQLTKALDKTTSTTTKTELETQINDLKTILTKANDFVKTQEGKFSLFGWMVRMFSK